MVQRIGVLVHVHVYVIYTYIITHVSAWKTYVYLDNVSICRNHIQQSQNSINYYVEATTLMELAVLSGCDTDTGQQKSMEQLHVHTPIDVVHVEATHVYVHIHKYIYMYFVEFILLAFS